MDYCKDPDVGWSEGYKSPPLTSENIIIVIVKDVVLWKHVNDVLSGFVHG